MQETSFNKAFIPLKNKLKAEGADYAVNEFVCPKMKRERDCVTRKSRRVCHCENPCTSSGCGRMIYLCPEKNLRAYPGTARGTEEWDSTYKIRVNVEKSIHHFKDSFCIAGRKTQNEKTLHADLRPAGIT